MSEETLELQAAELVNPVVSPASSEIPDWLKNMNVVAPTNPILDAEADKSVPKNHTETTVDTEEPKKTPKSKSKTPTPKPKSTTQDIAPTLDTKDLPDWLK